MIEDCAKIAFEAYCKAKENKTYDNKPIPKWEDLPQDVKEAWKAVGEAVLEVITAAHY